MFVDETPDVLGTIHLSYKVNTRFVMCRLIYNIKANTLIRTSLVWWQGLGNTV